MSIFEIIILGILQGLTEFLPVSSSGHLVIAQYILDIEYSGNTIEILFHIGTLGSVLFIFFDDINQYPHMLILDNYIKDKGFEILEKGNVKISYIKK